MPRGILKNGKRRKRTVIVKRKYAPRPSYSQMNVEPMVPTVHLERGSGGEYRYGVRAPGLTVGMARQDAVREFRALEMAVEELKATVRGLNGK